MHRSGTSALTRVINLLGAKLPSNLMRPRPDDNEAGFWESLDIAALNDDLLKSGQSSWDDFSDVSHRSAATARAGYERRAVELLERDFSRCPVFVIKDPRICRLVPFWTSVFRRFGAEPLFVHIIRNPLEVAASLGARDGLIPAQSHLMWLGHVLSAEIETRNFKRTFVFYDELLRSWQDVSDKMSRELQIKWPVDPRRAAPSIEKFLVPGLRHQRSTVAALNTHADVPPWSKRAYHALKKLARDGGAGPLQAIDKLQAEWKVAEAAFHPLVGELRERAIEEDRLADIEKRLAGLGRIDELREALAVVENKVSRLCELQLGARIQNLSDQIAKIGEIEESVAASERRVAATEAQIRGLTNEVQTRDVQIRSLIEDVQTRDIQVHDLTRDIATRDHRMHDLTKGIETRDIQIHDLTKGIETRDIRIHDLTKEIQARDVQIHDLIKQVETRDVQIQSRAKQAETHHNEIRWLRQEVHARDGQRHARETAVAEMFQEISKVASLDET